MILKLIPVFTFALLTACYQAADIQDFDEEAFKGDPFGCEGIRQSMRKQVQQLPQSLKGLNQYEVEATLGNADREELSNRSQKYLFYFIEPGPDCNGTAQDPFTMVVRFNSVGQANEISFQNY